MVEILAESEVVESCTLGTLRIPSLEVFKSHHGIKSYRRFGESGSVDMAALANTLPAIRDVMDQYAWKDIYNMDQTGLFYRM